MTEIRSGVYRPNPDKCCERCCFGSGLHSVWCPKWMKIDRYMQWAIDRAMSVEAVTELQEALFGGPPKEPFAPLPSNS